MSESNLISAQQFAQVLTADTPLIDLRAPVEFARGAFPAATNLWLMTDEERADVGTCYKRHGPDAAVALGQKLVSGAVRQRRLERWIQQIERQPDTLIYCFRGGQRSTIVQSWLAETGCSVPRIEGGYKALRQFLIDRLAQLCQTQNVLILGGLAGSGKTHLLPTLANSLDLEGLANHRGSAFGRRVAGHPAPIDFENSLIIRWLKLSMDGHQGIVTEDESRTIGRLAIPEPLWSTLCRSPIAVIDEPLDQRVARIISDYVTDNLADCLALDPEQGFDRFRQELLDSLARVEKRLGGVRYQQMAKAMEAALDVQAGNGDVSGHGAWVRPLLVDYYDPMYAWQLEKKMDRVVFRGNASAVAEFARDQTQQAAC